MILKNFAFVFRTRLRLCLTLLLVLTVINCKPKLQDGSKFDSAENGTNSNEDPKGFKFWRKYLASSETEKMALIRADYCLTRAKVPDFDTLYPNYDPILGYSVGAAAFLEVIEKEPSKNGKGFPICKSKNPSSTDHCYACDYSAGCYNCFYHILKENGAARNYYAKISGDSNFYWDTTKEGRMNECSWARSFADYFEPATFGGRIQEAGYSRRWFDEYPGKIRHKSQSILKDDPQMVRLASLAPPGTVVIWGVCGQHIPKGCNGIDGIGHISITGVNSYSLGNYIGSLPSGPCGKQKHLGILIPVLAQGKPSAIDCNGAVESLAPASDATDLRPVDQRR